MHGKDTINLELVNDIKSKSKCTKYKEQYTKEFRVKIFILREHGLTYRGIMEYCMSEYGFSPSIGHIKKLITDGEKYFSREENNKDNDNIAEEKSIAKNEKLLKQKDDFDLEKTNTRISELMKDELTTCEREELIVSIVSVLKHTDKMHMNECA